MLIGCGQNYHKRCAYKIPNNCTLERKRKASVSNPASSHNLNGSICSQESYTSTVSKLQKNSTNFENIYFQLALVPQPSKTSKGSPRPLWIEGFATIRVPHTFQVSYLQFNCF